MTSHVRFVMRRFGETFSTQFAEVRIVPSVVLNIPVESSFRTKRFVTLTTFPYFHFYSKVNLGSFWFQWLLPFLHKLGKEKAQLLQCKQFVTTDRSKFVFSKRK